MSEFDGVIYLIIYLPIVSRFWVSEIKYFAYNNRTIGLLFPQHLIQVSGSLIMLSNEQQCHNDMTAEIQSDVLRTSVPAGSESSSCYSHLHLAETYVTLKSLSHVQL